MGMVQSLRGRIVGASLVLGLLIGTAFLALILSVRDARDAARSAERSERVAASASRLERLLLDLETGQRAYVITGRRSFLQPWDEALRAYPAEADRLRGLVRDRGQHARVDAIRSALDAYIAEWSQRVVDTVPASREEAARLVATGEGKRRVDALRRRFDAFLDRQRQLSAQRSQAAASSADRAVVLGLGGLAGSTLLVFLFAAYLIRSAVLPVEDVGRAARRLRSGDHDARASERSGRDEAARLTRDFNAMAQALSESFDEVARQGAELSAVLEAANEGIAMAAPDGELVFVNRRMEELWRALGAGDGATVGERFAAIAATTGTADVDAEELAAETADPEAVRQDDFEVPSLGRSFTGYTAPVRGPDGVIGRVFVLRETTEERAAERAKEQFLSTVSHELRTPLTSIIGFVELVRQGEVGAVSQEQDRFLSIVDRSARQLHALVDDLLTVGRTDEGRLDLTLEDVDLDVLAAEAVDAAATSAGEKRIALSLDAAGPVPLRGDRRRLTQLISNLVGNAIKFTPVRGCVDVRVRVEDPGVAVLEVADTGIGIAADEQEQLFERFFRATTATEAQVPGTGLGLAICKEIAEAHGGTIRVASAEGEGTTFRVELPGGQE